MSALGEILHGGVVSQDEIARVRDTVLFEGSDMRRRLVRFGVLLTLAAAISTFGLIGDSVATVIGAMIVAPLMLPIMGLAFGISIGDRRAVVSSIVIAVGGIAASITVGYLLTLLMGDAFDPTQVPQIMIRTSPKLIDLLAALATGLAGAFAIGRKDVSDTLPGVAIAISLVPPLANVGILLSTGYADLALGSLLLFVTNYFAILLTGALVFGLMGYPAVVMGEQSVRSKRIAVAVVISMLIVIAVPLGLTSATVIQQRTVYGAATDATEQWLADTGFRLVSIGTADRLDIVIAGEGDAPAVEDLQALLDGQIYGWDVHLETVPLSVNDFETAPPE